MRNNSLGRWQIDLLINRARVFLNFDDKADAERELSRILAWDGDAPLMVEDKWARSYLLKRPVTVRLEDVELALERMLAGAEAQDEARKRRESLRNSGIGFSGP